MIFPRQDNRERRQAARANVMDVIEAYADVSLVMLCVVVTLLSIVWVYQEWSKELMTTRLLCSSPPPA